MSIAVLIASALSLGGVVIGGSILDDVKHFGIPTNLQSVSRGHEWDWSDWGGLDREVLTDDNLVIRSVLVAPAPTKHAQEVQPPEAPILGMNSDAAKDVIAQSAGATAVEGLLPDTIVWQLDGGVLVAELDGGVVTRIRALDEQTAHVFGYVAPSVSPPPYRAPSILHDVVPPPPQGSGTVILRVAIDATGHATDAKVVVSSGNAGIDAAELLRMRKATFQPALCGANPCAGVYMDVDSYTSDPM